VQPYAKSEFLADKNCKIAKNKGGGGQNFRKSEKKFPFRELAKMERYY